MNPINPIPNLSVSKRKQYLLPWLIFITLLFAPLPVAPSAQAQGFGDPPTIEGQPSDFLNVPGVGPAYVSGVVDDPTDPAATSGINFTIDDPDTALADLNVSATSNNIDVVPDDNDHRGLSGSGDSRNLKITPVGVGYAIITVKVEDAVGNVANYTIEYAASQASVTPDATRYHTGASEASATIAVDDAFMLVGEDEDQTIRRYDRRQSGLLVDEFNFNVDLGLCPPGDENCGPSSADFEGATRAGDRIYWIGSHSNSNKGNIKENRYRLFATDLSGNDLSFTGYYAGLRTYNGGVVGGDLIDWGDLHGYNFTASAAQGISPKVAEGFNIEGLAMAPDGTTAWIGFRAPLITSTGGITRALIAPLTNIDDLVTGAASEATFGDPIELDLEGRGIRGIERKPDGDYLIIAGPPGNAGFQLYTWTGDSVEDPVLVSDLAAPQPGGSYEAVVDLPTTLPDGKTYMQLLVDNGTTVWYNDGTESQNLRERNYQKFRSEFVLPASGQAPAETTVLNTNDSGADSLRQAIADVAGGGAITFAPGLAGGTITLTSGPLSIDKAVTIDASAAAGLTISGNNARQVFIINAGATVTLSTLTIRDGNTDSFGGGIANAGALTIINSVIEDNNAGGSGGGIDNEGTLTIINSGLYNNASNSFGGAIANDRGAVSMLNSTLSGNMANGNSSASDGGGAINQFGVSSVMTITHSTITNNSAPNVAGRDGIWLEDGLLTVRNSIVAANGADNNGANCTIDGGTFAPDGENIDNGTSCSGFSQPNTDPNLGPLSDNGGPSLTHALLPGSPAIDAVPAAACSDVTTDQRGIVRPQGTACDIGAFELVSNNTPPVANDQNISTPQDQPVAITLTASDVDGDLLTYLVVGDPAHGALNGAAPDLTYTPNPGYSGSDSFQFKANDGQADSNAATVTISVEASAPSDHKIFLPLVLNRSSSGVFPTALVPAGAVWKYLDNGSNQGTGWREASFDDSSWSQGEAQLGYGDGDEATAVGYGPDANNKYITTYFRHTFSLSNSSDYKMLDLRLLRDDGAVVYLNNQEVFRSNMPAGGVTYTTRASGAVGGEGERTWYQQAINPSWLVSGKNVLAVEIHQANSTSSDISFDLALSGIPSGVTRFAVIGDYGIAGGPEEDVANLVKSWESDFVITVGDNNYPIGAQETIVANIDQYYGDFINDDFAATRFFPSLGNHDWVSMSCAAGVCSGPYLNHFSLPGNERYYDFSRSKVHFFALDSDRHEPDGRTKNSSQANWLNQRLAGATEPWKIVYFHHAPYSSGNHGSDAAMQWPYEEWGASAVLAGHDHNYERLDIGGLPYFVNGLGGAGPRECKSPPVEGSQKCFVADYGAMLVEADDCQMTFNFITRAHAVVDTFTLGGNCR